jgi:hypothetical protein
MWPFLKASPHPDKARCSRREMFISSGIMFLMYRFGGLVALVYIRRSLTGEDREPKTDQGFYRSWWHHPRTRATHNPRQNEGRVV